MPTITVYKGYFKMKIYAFLWMYCLPNAGGDSLLKRHSYMYWINDKLPQLAAAELLLSADTWRLHLCTCTSLTADTHVCSKPCGVPQVPTSYRLMSRIDCWPCSRIYVAWWDFHRYYACHTVVTNNHNRKFRPCTWLLWDVDVRICITTPIARLKRAMNARKQQQKQLFKKVVLQQANWN